MRKLRRVNWDSRDPILLQPENPVLGGVVNVKLQVDLKPGDQLMCVVIEIDHPVIAYLQGKPGVALIGIG